MSNFDPSSPGYVPPGAILAYCGNSFVYREGNQTATALIASSTISASTAVSVENHDCLGALFVLDLTSLPGSASTTIALKINIVAGRTATIAARAAVSSTGTYVLMCYPGVSASAGGQATPLPHSFRPTLSLSTGATSKECVLSLHMMRIV